ncbi:MAG TPA: YceI family protein [Planctomycetota bacterium]|nr:YceI family protein [Planctomycetota bacterium]
MATKLLQWLGALFIVLLVATAIGGLLVLKDRVRVVVQSDAPTSGPDPTALLRDDVQVLASRMGELQAALSQNFDRLQAAIEERTAARHADVIALRQEVGTARQLLDRLTQDLVALRGQVRGLQPQAAPQQQPAPANPRVESAAEAAVPVEVAPSPPAHAEPAPAVPQAKPAPGFLSFSLPAVQFRCDELQDYALLPGLCRVGFDAKSTLHDFTGVTEKVAGRFAADFDDPEGAWSGEVTVDAGSLVTGVEGRDTDMWEHLATKEHPQIRFAIQRFRPAPGGIDVQKQTARGDIDGKMTIRGQTRSLTMPVQLEVDPQKRVVVSGQVPLKLSDYGVPVPSQLGIINMQDEVVVWIALRARMQPKGHK